MRTIRIAVLGAGEWACARHLPALRALSGEAGREAGIDLRIAGIWNRTRDRALRAARAFELPRVYDSLDQVVDDHHLDCFSVLVHPSALSGIVDRLRERRLPIFCEKPPGMTYAESLALARKIHEPNLVAFNRRYMPIGRRYRQMVKELADVYFAECRFYRSGRVIRRFVLETGVHGINFMEFLLGPIREVGTETLGAPSRGARPRVCRVRFDSGVQGILKFFPSCGSSVERYEVHGKDTSLYLHVPMEYTTDHPGRIIVHRNGREESGVEDESREVLTAEGFLAEYLDFFTAVADRSPTVSDLNSACNTMRIAEAVEAGRETGTAT